MTGDDADVLLRAKRGDRTAFGQIVRHHHRRVYLTALRIMGNHSDADDVCQEAFLRAFRGLSRFDQRAQLATWLHRVVVNTALNHLRARNRQAGIESELSREPSAPASQGRTAPSPEVRGQIGERFTAVLGAFCQLSASLRVTLALAVFEGLTYKDISELLDIPEGTVAWRVNEARRKLRGLLSEVNSVTDTE